ncbi:MAG: hypothetical protein Q8K92_06285 [Leadbetterella sp.]|nr:hypothetical protein [Leadbetterella sp.]
MSFSAFSAISESTQNQLVGGFSTSISIEITPSNSDALSNNCHGGNCTPSCGSNDQNLRGCNTYNGCY